MSAVVCRRLQALAAVAAAAPLVAYMAFDREVDLTDLLGWWRARGETVLLPRFDTRKKAYALVDVADAQRQTVTGKYGIREPDPELPAVSGRGSSEGGALWLVPGVAFDSSGQRLGRGKGIYDRLLSGHCGMKVGIAYDWQILDSLPASRHDVTMDAIVSENRVLEIGQSG